IENQELLNNIPQNDWQFFLSMAQNELFVVSKTLEEIKNAIKENKLNELSTQLYRIQKLSETDYYFRHHLETKLEKNSNEEKQSMFLGKVIRIRSLKALKELQLHKVQINSIGKIKLVN
ncbi:MAG TPA: hypothetical protein PK977_16275, partial [Chitinophagaceae bacterium]|nr:hypothetical protein [Chitinophagaceae bacterium]